MEHTIFIWVWDHESWGLGETPEEARAAARKLSQSCVEEPEPEEEDPVVRNGYALKLSGPDLETLWTFARRLVG